MDDLKGLKGRRCLVTGGAGFIGTALVRLLRREGALVSAPARHEVDLRDAAAVSQWTRAHSPDAVFHLAAEGVTDSVDVRELAAANVLGVRNLIESIIGQPGRPKVLLLGSGFEYAPQERPCSETDPLSPFSPYGASKAEAAAVAAALSPEMPVAWVRPFNVYGPGEQPSRLLPSIVASVVAGRPAEVTPGEQLRDFTFVEDVAEALVKILLSLPDRPCWETYNIGTGRPARLRDFIGLAADALRARGFSPDVRFGARPYRLGEPMCYLPDVTRLRQRLGWTPPTTIEDGISRTLVALLNK